MFTFSTLKWRALLRESAAYYAMYFWHITNELCRSSLDTIHGLTSYLLTVSEVTGRACAHDHLASPMRPIRDRHAIAVTYEAQMFEVSQKYSKFLGGIVHPDPRPPSSGCRGERESTDTIHGLTSYLLTVSEVTRRACAHDHLAAPMCPTRDRHAIAVRAIYTKHRCLKSPKNTQISGVIVPQIPTPQLARERGGEGRRESTDTIHGCFKTTSLDERVLMIILQHRCVTFVVVMRSLCHTRHRCLKSTKNGERKH